MKINEVSIGEVTITVPLDEVRFLADAINETLNAISVREFKTRTGTTREKADDVRRQLVDALKAIVAHEKEA